MISTNSKIYLAGHRGLLGAAINKQLQASGYQNVVTRTRAETDLRNQALVEQLFARERPEAVILSAARVAGQQAVSSQCGDYLQANLAIGLNVIDAARRWGIAEARRRRQKGQLILERCSSIESHHIVIRRCRLDEIVGPKLTAT